MPSRDMCDFSTRSKRDHAAWVKPGIKLRMATPPESK